MLDTARRRRLRILLSEGSSTSAREAVTVLGLQGHEVEICDPDPHCISRFSRFVHRFHRCPGLGVDPEAYLAFVIDLLSRRRFDVLLPIHEQGFLFAKVRQRLLPYVAVALPTFASYERAHSKVEFSRLLTQLDLPQPQTALVASRRELLDHESVPVVVKAAIGTASRGVWIVTHPSEMERAAAELEQGGAFSDKVLVQEWIDGPIEHAQAIFCDGRLLAMHAYRQISRGAGGGDAAKEGIHRPLVRSHLAHLGAALGWHGALSVDYILSEDRPLYIDCNPRLVEPVNALLSGLDLTDLLLRVSLGETAAAVSHDRAGVRTHLALQALLGCAIQSGSRWELTKECQRLLTKRGIYTGSVEELTPARWDALSIIPVVAAALWLLANPKAALHMPKRGWGSHLLTPASIRIIRERLSAVEETSPAET